MDHGTLRVIDDHVVCSECQRRFEIRQGVPDLDVVVSPDREAFDARFRDQETMSEADRSSSLALADRFLTVLNRDLRSAHPRCRLQRTCGITLDAVAGRASGLYAKLREALPSSLHRVVPHFKFYVLEKR